MRTNPERRAVVGGKTNLHLFATGLVGTRSPYGAVPDARRPEFVSGGSSSGSAVAVARGEADLAIGTDTAGSGRVPAAFQGLVGIKPTVGVVRTDGVVPACRSYDCVTIFAADPATADRAMGVLAAGAAGRPWPGAPRRAPPPPPGGGPGGGGAAPFRPPPLGSTSPGWASTNSPTAE